MCCRLKVRGTNEGRFVQLGRDRGYEMPRSRVDTCCGETNLFAYLIGKSDDTFVAFTNLSETKWGG